MLQALGLFYVAVECSECEWYASTLECMTLPNSWDMDSVRALCVSRCGCESAFAGCLLGVLHAVWLNEGLCLSAESCIT
jgi:hypothetical protein